MKIKMDPESQRWVQAAIKLGKDPLLKVLCPVCQEVFLEVMDVEYENDPNLFERYLTCPKCGALNVMRCSHKSVDTSKNKNVLEELRRHLR